MTNAVLLSEQDIDGAHFLRGAIVAVDEATASRLVAEQSALYTDEEVRGMKRITMLKKVTKDGVFYPSGACIDVEDAVADGLVADKAAAEAPDGALTTDFGALVMAQGKD